MLSIDYINVQHPNVKFTHEKQLNGKFPFLVLVDNSSNVWVFETFFETRLWNLHNSTNCKNHYTPNCFKILDLAKTTYTLKLKEAIHI